MKYLLLTLLVITIVGEIVILVGLNIVDDDLHKQPPAQGVQLKPVEHTEKEPLDI